jgi:hypothetical protein
MRFRVGWNAALHDFRYDQDGKKLGGLPPTNWR